MVADKVRTSKRDGQRDDQEAGFEKLLEDMAMQVLCERSNAGNDVRCAVCGQGFLVYWERSSRAERESARKDVMQAIRDQHDDVTSGHHAHPAARFTVPSWTGNPAYSGAALLGGETAYAI